ncbi:MAG TPA: serine/threonine-protein kinase [Ktedonobacteraceae bacterium]|nr:serine/threonine-protein kinase [Ktedonobacteraceae bacterium]
MSNYPRRIGNYELRQELGRGKAGEVWRGYDYQTSREVAIKLLYLDLQADPHFLTHFLQEGQSVLALHHAHLVTVHDIGVARSPETDAINQSLPYLVMDYIDGPNFAHYLQRTSHAGKFPSIPDIVYLISSIGEALDYAHENGVIHGDIQPANILLNAHDTSHVSAGEPLLADIGITALIGNASMGSSKPYYLSPEQAKEQAATASSDIYALGVILYEMCTGKLPFQAESNVALMMHHINTLPTPPVLINPNIPQKLSEVILRAMSKNPQMRYTKASQLVEMVADAFSLNLKLNKPIPSTTQSHARLSLPGGQNSGIFTTILGVSQPVPPVSSPLPTIAAWQFNAQPHTTSAVAKIVPPTEPPTTAPRSTPTRVESGQSGVFEPLPRASMPMPTVLPHSGMSTTSAQPAHIPPSATPSAKLPVASMPSAKIPVASIPRNKGFTLSPILLAIIALILLLLVVGSLAASLLLHNTNNQQPPTTGVVVPVSSIAGQVFFQDDALGHNDMLRVDMKNIAAPAAGKQYVAWIEEQSGRYLPLGTLTLQQGNATLLYPGDGKHSNLLSLVQGVIITLENAGGKMPAAPSLNAKVYTASFAPASLPYIKNLLDVPSNSKSQASLIVNLYETIQGMNDKAGSTVDSLQINDDYGLAIRQATRIIEMIDGTDYANKSGDLPSNIPGQLTLPTGLISSPTTPGYIDMVATQVEKIQATTGNDSVLLQHARNVANAIADLRNWIQNMRTLTVQILKAPDIRSASLIGVALQLKQLADDVYTGRTIPPNAGPLPILGSAGAYQGYIECQYMAALNLVKA